jgi:ankyrin repeat protein
MVKRLGLGLVAAAGLLAATDYAQAPPKVDFVRDVQPILRQNCYGCHGPTQQMNGFRLDRRRDAMRGGTVAMIGPGNSEGSRLYNRLIGAKFGLQMPPTGALPLEQIGIIKAWIDQGAEWPDEASGEAPTTIPDPAATKLIIALRYGDFASFKTMSAANPRAVSQKGPGGSTPLMFAALHADAATLRELLDTGADPNVRNDAGATALMWAAPDVEKARVLIEHGADVNAKSDDARTPLLIAAGAPGSVPTVKLLVDRGAKVNVKAPFIAGYTTPLTEAASIGNAEAFKVLVAAGADLKFAGPPALGLAFRAECMSCAEALLKAFDPPQLTGTMLMSAPPLGPALGTPMFLERGAIADARDPDGRTMLMLAAASDTMPVDAVKALLAHGVDVNARTVTGETALDLARRHGKTPVVDVLVAAGAKDEPAAAIPSPAPAASARAAVERSLPLLQKNSRTFLQKAGCVSCHNNTLTAMTVATARTRKFAVDETIAREQAGKIGTYLDSWRERALQGVPIPGDADTMSYILAGLAAEHYPADAATDAQARLIKQRQCADGRWRILANRPPLESSDLEVTAVSMRALQAYAPKGERADYEKSVRAAAAWLAAATPRSNEDRVFQLLGLSWSNADRDRIEKAGRALRAEQRPDGGWAQIPSMQSDAYATGQALVALVESGDLPEKDPAIKRGIDFLLKNQLADGSWFVRTRAIPIQPLFDSGFPYGRNAFISASATNWATRALAMTLQ